MNPAQYTRPEKVRPLAPEIGTCSGKNKSDLLTQTGPDTPMGRMFRSYWIPALLAEELPENDCPPVRVKLLSERLLAFRDTDGRYGLIDEFCAHRGVSLWFGRNEECGLRCAYHGWKYDVTGQCVEIPSEPEASRFTKESSCSRTRWSSAAASCGRTWDRRRRSRRCPNGNSSPCRALRRSRASASRNPTGSRRWRAGSIPATCRSCIAATSTPTRCSRAPKATSTT